MKFVEEVNAFGVRVFGSSQVSAESDSAAISLGVSRTDLDPKIAFDAARSGSAAVLKILEEEGIEEFGSSRVTLVQKFRHTQDEHKLVGYTARIGLLIKLVELERLEPLLTKVIAAGANELTSVVFQTSKLVELQAKARKLAIESARQRAELCCRETGVKLGRLVSIEDMSDDKLDGTGERKFYTGGVASGGAEKAIDPAKISVGVSLFLTYKIAD